MRILQNLILFSLVVFASCKKDPKVETPVVPVTPIETPKTNPSLAFSFNAIANNSPLVIANKGYVNEGGDHFTVALFNYYITNVRLKRDDGFEFVEPESYHLIRHSDGKTSFTVSNLPEGNYTSVDFLIGVDAARNTSGAQTGDLDVNNYMFWDWDQGYIFFKLEGNYLAKNKTTDAFYAIHVAGFEGKYGAIKPCTYNLNTPIIATKGDTSKIYFNTVVDEIFKNPKTIAIDDYLVSPGDAGMKMMADNYADMIVVDKVEN
ncbi:MAG: hypothetical protein JNL60_06160 [Bacteroidia bacterium]|nr:hypothetical protein [Bacteroidia bacterium]